MTYQEILEFVEQETQSSNRIVLKLSSGQILVGYFKEGEPYSKNDSNQWCFVETKGNPTQEHRVLDGNLITSIEIVRI